jgi:hypothetical protein
MSTVTHDLTLDTQAASRILRRVCDDVSTVIDRPMTFRDPRVSRIERRASGDGQIHISFKLEMRQDGLARHGCLLLPLPEAISLACYLMMVPDDIVAQHRKQKDLERTLKDAMLEIGNFVGGATEAALREFQPEGRISVRSRGCQGVRAGVRPAFPYEEGSPLILTRATAQVAEFKEFELLLQLPPLAAG